MFSWSIEQYTIEHRHAMKRAQQEVLAQEVMDEERREQGQFNPALAWVGQRMIEVGTKLVKRSRSGGESDEDTAKNLN